jgi:uncharacterized protein
MTHKPNRFKSLLRWIGWALLVQFILINISAALYAYKLTHYYKQENKSVIAAKGNFLSRSWRLFTGPRYPRPLIAPGTEKGYEIIDLETKKGKQLEGWYRAADSNKKGTVILFHGITVTKAELLDEARAFLQYGYNVMLVDFRGHGNSAGNTTTIGMRESEEVKIAFDYINGKGEKNIFLYGTSLGAVAIAKAIDEYAFQPTAVILEMPFLSLQTYLKGRARILGFPAQPFGFLTTFWIGVEQGYNGFRHQTSRYARAIQCPVLMQWGSLDNLVVREETEKVFASIASKQKKLVIYEGAMHESFLRKDPNLWQAETMGFLKANSH